MSRNPFSRQHLFSSLGGGGQAWGGGGHRGDADEDEEEEDRIVYDRRGSGYPSALQSTAVATNPQPAGEAGGRTATTATETQQGSSSLQQGGANPSMGGQVAITTARSEQDGLARRTAVAPTWAPPPRTLSTDTESDSLFASSPSSPFGTGMPARRGAGGGPSAAGSTATCTPTGLPVDAAVMTLDSAVRVPRGLRAAATRRTMLDVLLETKRAQEAARAAEQRRLQQLQDITLPELLKRRGEGQRMDGRSGGETGGRDRPHGALGGSDGSRAEKDDAPRAEERNQQQQQQQQQQHRRPSHEKADRGGGEGDQTRSLRHLLPSHLRKDGRAREVERALERRRQVEQERAMALDISDFSSSSSSSSKGGDNSDGGHIGGRARGRGAGRQQEKQGTVLALLDDGDNDLHKDGNSRMRGDREGRRKSKEDSGPAGRPRATQQQQLRSVADLLFHDDDDDDDSRGSKFGRRASRHAAVAVAVAQSQSQRRGRTGGITATDLLDDDLDAANLVHAHKGQGGNRSGARGRGDGGARHRDAVSRAWVADDNTGSAGSCSDEFGAEEEEEEEERKRLLRQQQQQQQLQQERLYELLDDPQDDHHSHHHDGGDGDDTSSNGGASRRWGEAGAAEAAAADSAGARGSRRWLYEQQRQWVRVHQHFIAQCEQNRDDDGDADGDIRRGGGGLGIIGKPCGLTISSIAATATAAAPAATASWRVGTAGAAAATGPFGSLPRTIAGHAASSPSSPFGDGRLVDLPQLLVDTAAVQNRRQKSELRGRRRVAASRPIGDSITATRVVDYLQSSFDRWLLDGPALAREVAQRREQAEEAQEQLMARAAGGAISGSSPNRSNVPDVVTADITAEEGGATAARDDDAGAASREAVVSLEGRGVHVKLRAAYSESAFGVTRVVGDVEWMSAAAQRRCGAVPSSTPSSPVSGDAARAGFFFGQWPAAEHLAARRWTVVLPEHLFRAVPLALGRFLYIGDPFFPIPAAQTILSSYCVTTDVLVERMCAAYTAAVDSVTAYEREEEERRRAARRRRRRRRLSSGSSLSSRCATPTSESHDRSRNSSGDKHRRGRASGGEEDDGGDGHRGWSPSSAFGDGSSQRTPVPRRHRGGSRGGEDGVGEAIPASLSASRTPFRGNHYDPLAVPGIALFHSAMAGKQEGVHTSADNDNNNNNNVSRQEDDSVSRGGGRLSVSVDSQQQQQQQRGSSRRRGSGRSEDGAATRRATEDLDPVGAGFPRGPNADWYVPLETLRVIAAAAQQHAPPEPPHHHRPRPLEHTHHSGPLTEILSGAIATQTTASTTTLPTAHSHPHPQQPPDAAGDSGDDGFFSLSPAPSAPRGPCASGAARDSTQEVPSPPMDPTGGSS